MLLHWRREINQEIKMIQMQPKHQCFSGRLSTDGCMVELSGCSTVVPDGKRWSECVLRRDVLWLFGVTCTDLQQYVRAVMDRHHNGSNTDVVWNPGEAQKNQRGHMMNHLLFEVLLSHRRQVKMCVRHKPSYNTVHTRSDFADVFKHTHLPFHIKGQAEEQGDIEAQLHYVIPVLRRQHGLHKHIENRHFSYFPMQTQTGLNCCRGIKDLPVWGNLTKPPSGCKPRVSTANERNLDEKTDNKLTCLWAHAWLVCPCELAKCVEKPWSTKSDGEDVTHAVTS